MKIHRTRLTHRALTGLVATSLCAVAIGAQGVELDGERLIHADREPGNWMTYHGTYKSWHYSPLNQINTSNVTKLGSVVARRFASEPRVARLSVGCRWCSVLLESV